MKLSIKNKIIILYIAVIIISVSSIGYIGFKSTSQSYIDSSLSLNQNKTNSLALGMEEHINNVPSDIHYLVNFYGLQRYFIWKSLGEMNKVKKWEEVFSHTLIDFMQKRESFYRIKILNNNADELVSLHYDKVSKNVHQVSKNSLKNYADEKFFKQSQKLQKEQFYISKIALHEENGKVITPHIATMQFATPIVDSNGERHGIFVAYIFIDNYLKVFDEFTAKKQDISQHFLIDKEGTYIYHKDKNRRWSKQLSHKGNFNHDYPNVLEKFSGDEGVFIKNDSIFSFKKMHVSHELMDNYVYAVSQISTNIALKELDQFKQKFLIITLLILAIAYFVVAQYIAKITKPLKKVSEQLSNLSQGQINENLIAYKSHDEIGDLVNASKILTHSMQMTIMQTKAVSEGDFEQEIKLLSKNDELGKAIQKMLRRLQDVASLATELSNGNYNVQVEVNSKDDKLGYALVQMIEYLENITHISESISVGNLDVQYELKSNSDRLGQAMLAMTSYLNTIYEQANAISQDDFSKGVVLKSKDDDLGKALLLMNDKLKSNMQKNKEDIWFSDGINKFINKLRKYDTVEEISNYALSMLTRYVNASSSLVYALDSKKELLNLKASYAFAQHENMQQFRVGEGIIGQVIIDKKPIMLENIEDEKYTIYTGTNNIHPNQTFVVPLIKDLEVLGAMEFVTINQFTKLEQDFLVRAAEILASVFYDTLQNLQIKELLEQSQRAFEELQSSSEELQVSNEQMEEQSQLLEEQARDLKEQNAKLEEAKKELDKRAEELKKSSEYKSEFLANMSHELRTPLNSIILLSSLLEDNKKENLLEADIQKAKVIHQSGNELLRLISDILDLSKIEAGKMELIIDEIDSNDFLSYTQMTFEEMANDKGIEFIVKDELEGIFYNDKDRLSQIIRNLISNAFKFTKEGSVTLKASKTDDELFPIEISVSDTGVGIPVEKQEMIFKAFMQADGSTSREYGGTGLGLSITKELTHLMQGEIFLESKQGKGSTFTLKLPSLKEQYSNVKSEVSVKVESKKAPTLTENSFNGKNILIIEDDESFVEVLKESVSSKGLNTLVAYNGSDGLELASKHQLTGIIVDLGLPDMDGMDVVYELKNNHLTKDIPIQIISGIEKEQFKSELPKQVDFLQKPVNATQIEKVINEFHHKHKSSVNSILIVEDDITHQQAINEYISEEREVNIQNCSTVECAITALKESTFDVVIIDLKLTDGSGEEVCRFINENQIDTYVLIYTSRELSIDESEYLQSICDEIIIKNMNSHKRLQDELNHFLNHTYNKKSDKRQDEVDYSVVDISNLDNKKVLIVDDDIKNIFVLSTALQECNMQTIHAKNGKEALEILQNSNDIDIVLMDVMMPVMNGYEAMQAIREDNSLKHLPVIAVTAKARPTDRQESINHGADDYLSKPIDLKKLKSMISMWLNKSR